MELVSDESLRAAITASLKLRTFTARRTSWLTRITCWFESLAPPMDYAFDVSVRDGEQEWPVGQIVSEFGQRPSNLLTGQVANSMGNRVDLILRPSQAAARTSLRITKIWDGEIVIEDVQVTPSR